MKLKTIKIIKIIILAIVFSLIIECKAWAYPNLNIYPYTVDPNLFCGEHNASLYLQIDGVYSTDLVSEISFNSLGSEKMNIAVAYACYLGLSGQALAEVIWSTAGDNPENNIGEYASSGSARVEMYRNVYNTIFSKSGKDVFKSLTDSSSLKVLVNQTNGTYTVGPYKMGLRYGKGTQAANDLISELSSSDDTEGKFAWYDGVTLANATNVQILNASGNVITMPNFASEQEFYIRFKPKDGQAIIQTPSPVFKFRFLTELTGTLERKRASSVKYNYTYKDSEIKGKVSFSNDIYSHDYTWYEDRNVTIEKEIKNDAIIAGGSTIAKFSKTFTVRRTYYYDEDGNYLYYSDSIYGDKTASGTATIFKHNTGSPRDNAQDLVKITSSPSGGGSYNIKIEEQSLSLGGTPVDMQIGGTVWLEKGEVKTNNIDGQRKTDDKPFAGIQVQLYESNGTLVATTTTDVNGRYRFFGQIGNNVALINALKKYYIVFTYNGQLYQSTYYKYNLTGGFSNAKDVGRNEYNIKFRDIYSDASNYNANGWHKAFAMQQKIEKSDGSYISYNGGALKYKDVYDKFLEYAKMTNTYEVDNKNDIKPTSNDYKEVWTNKYSKSYEDVLNGNTIKISGKTFTQWLSNTMKASDSEITAIKQFIRDTYMTASTKQKDSDNKDILYPKFNEFVIKNLFRSNSYKTRNEDLNDNNKIDDPYNTTTTSMLGSNRNNLYSYSYDMARHTDYGVCNRIINDLALQKDVYQASVIVNGKKENYIYNKKNLNNAGTWEVKVRAGEALYNGGEVYERKIRSSEYLYDGSDAGTTDAKNLQVYVMYRISIKNQGAVNAKINEIVDYYDSDAYSFDGTLSGDLYTIKKYNYSPTESKRAGQNENQYVNSFVGSDAKGTKIADLTVKTKGIPNTSRNQETIEKNGKYKYSTLYLTGIKSSSGDDILIPGELAFVYVTFKVNIDNATGKIKLDQNLLTEEYTVGKRNIAEINAYSTYYVKDTKIPNTLNSNNVPQNTNISNDSTAAGIIDIDSNPGNLKAKDLNDRGDIITNEDNEVIDRQEDDTDKSPNIQIIINQNDDEIRRFNGFVFEEQRTTQSQKAVIGNGQYDDGETKVNGVTLELVELIQDVDENGIFKGTYLGEKVWESYTYKGLDKASLETADKNNPRYASGQGLSRVVITGPKDTIFEIKPDDIGVGNGSYSFKSIPAGDFYIRFKYGDHTETVLTNTSNEVNNLIENSGLNAKSYNGQDFKSTVYQSNISQENSSYNGIDGFIRYEFDDNTNVYAQNYTKKDNSGVIVAGKNDDNGGVDTKQMMYYYNKERSQAVPRASDSKDVYYYRQKGIDYSKGHNGTTLLNNRAEVLASFEKLATYKPYIRNDNGVIQDDGSGNAAIDKEAQKTKQIDMINELIANTQMVAQTGIINTQIELHGQEVNDKKSETTYNKNQDYFFKLENINLGLVERPKAGLRLNKEVENVRIDLINQVIDTSKSVRNLYFSEHQPHVVNYEIGLNKIREIILNNNNAIKKPELIQAYLDDELLKIATIQVKYKITVENFGEIDYRDKKFYYTGIEDSPNDNISKTRAVQVVDYLSNSIKYDPGAQDNQWKTRTVKELVTSANLNESGNLIGYTEADIEGDYVNREYAENLATYDVLLTTNDLDGELVPVNYNRSNSSKEVTLIASTKTTSNNGVNNLVYNNLAEIIETSNDLGRRNVYSISGNEEMQNQSLGNNAARGVKSSVDRADVKEIDADSAQKIVIMPPTGIKENYTVYMISIMAVTSLVMIITIIIRKKLKKE